MLLEPLRRDGDHSPMFGNKARTDDGNRPILVVYRLGGKPLQSTTDALKGFSLDRGSVDNGILTCHRHHARFALESGCTFGVWVDDPGKHVRQVALFGARNRDGWRLDLTTSRRSPIFSSCCPRRRAYLALHCSMSAAYGGERDCEAPRPEEAAPEVNRSLLSSNAAIAVSRVLGRLSVAHAWPPPQPPLSD